MSAPFVVTEEWFMSPTGQRSRAALAPLLVLALAAPGAARFVVQEARCAEEPRRDIGLFKDCGKFTWPTALLDERFKEERETLDRLGPPLACQAASDTVRPETLQAGQDAVAQLRARIKAAVEDLTPAEYISAMRYANQLRDSLDRLPRPKGPK